MTTHCINIFSLERIESDFESFQHLNEQRAIERENVYQDGSLGKSLLLLDLQNIKCSHG